MWTDSDIVIEWVWKKKKKGGGEPLLKHGNGKESIDISDDLWVCKVSFLVMIYFLFLKGWVLCIVFIWRNSYLTKITQTPSAFSPHAEQAQIKRDLFY